MKAIEDFNKDTRTLVNDVNATNEALRNALREAMEMLYESRLSVSSLCILEAKAVDYKMLIDSGKCYDGEHKAIVTMALRGVEYDIAKIKNVGVYYGV